MKPEYRVNISRKSLYSKSAKKEENIGEAVKGKTYISKGLIEVLIKILDEAN